MGGKDDLKKVQFVLDPSTLSENIAAEQSETGILALILNITTTWCYALNRTRIKLLGNQLPLSNSNFDTTNLNIMIDGFG